MWHTKSPTAVIEELRSSERGLRNEEVTLRIKQYGLNRLPEAKTDSLFTIFLRQFQSPLIYILVVASIVVFAIGEVVDGSIILAVLLINAVVGTFQEGKAQNALLALKKFVETKATVLRDDKEIIISDTELVPGDILIFQEGEKIPADARIIVSHNLKIDEATLTGESEPVHKTSEQQVGGETIGQYKNIAYKGTSIVAGSGRAIVIATGLQTTIGTIAKEIALIDTEIPLKGNIRHLSHLIIATVAIVSITIFILGIAVGKPVKDMFTTIVSLSVSIVPEGLPIVVTLILAMGVWRMSKRNALVKKLQAVESLGQASIIAVDKTGTITKNEMVIQKVYVGERMFEIGGIGYEPTGDISFEGRITDGANHPELLLAGKIGAFCAGARVVYSEEDAQFRVSGDPTEAAMLVLSQKLGFHKENLERESPVIEEIPFDYRLKYHAMLHEVDDKNFLTIVGAPEVVLELSETMWLEGKHKELSSEDRKKLESIFYQMSQEGLRVVAFAIEPDAGEILNPQKIRALTFVGFYGMKDATRSEALSAIQKAESAGVKVVMITGDHKVTAQAIAKEIGIWHEDDEVLTGFEIEGMSDVELSSRIKTVSVFARVNPEHKMRIIRAYRTLGEVVAMTGDGVNDAPSLVAADLGVAMGNIGTEVAKEASDIVLLDDNLESIVSAIEEGRSIYKTIKKVILYLFSTSMGEVLTITGALILGYPLPILAAQIIWLNFVTDGFLDMSLAMEPKEGHLLKGKFKKPGKYLVDKLMAKRMVIMSLVMALGTLYLFKNYYEVDLAKAWTMSLTVLAAFQWFNAWNCRSEYKSIFQMNPFSNRYLVGATVIVITLQLIAIYTPVMNTFLKTVPLNASDWIILVPIAALIVPAEEIRKLFYRRKFKKNGFAY
ncbi:MAG: ATPase [Candidatus Azambacteria bacterium GW2011_GWA1_44_9]|uniref:ATPase n=1 Tax=Candidatus Azambacteria bacterium GW2011_GWA1_44_9 TaxID=1618610 RepID=A0A0G1KC40_9BACT|nr:MAG: ATPase [Candidatus Azambacteria bacterium GW2011_GWA1_44_9]